jgi:hypothetical protein
MKEKYEIIDIWMLSSEIYYRVVRMWTDVSEEIIASVFRMKNQPSKKPVCRMRLGRISSSEKFVNFHWAAKLHILDGISLVFLFLNILCGNPIILRVILRWIQCLD